MKCPLWFIGRTAVIPKEGADIGDCLQGECAWWDIDQEKCAMLLIARALQNVDTRLIHIARNMPTELQFRK